MELLSTPFLQTAQGNLPSIVTFSNSFTTNDNFCHNSFDSSAPFQASSLPLRPSSVPFNAKTWIEWFFWTSWPNFWKQCPVYYDKKVKGINTMPWCNPTWTRKSSLKVPLTFTQLRAFVYIGCTIVHLCTLVVKYWLYTEFLQSPPYNIPRYSIKSFPQIYKDKVQIFFS